MTRENIRFGVIVAITIGMVAGALLLLRGGPPGPPPPLQEVTDDPPVARPSRPIEEYPASEDSDAAVVPAVDSSGEPETPRGNDRGVVLGKVVDENEEPVSRATVFIGRVWGPTFFSPRLCEEQAVRKVETDAAGEFELDKVPLGSYVGAATWKNMIAVSEREWTDGGRGAEMLLRLAPGLTIRGRVETTDGSPVAGAEARLRLGLREAQKPGGPARMPREKDLWRCCECPAVTESDAQGEFSLVGALGIPSFLTVRAEGFAPGVAGPLDGDVSGVRVVLTAGGGISGRVVDADSGQPIANERILARSPVETPPLNSVTDEEGRFSFSCLRPGTYSLCHTSTRYVTSRKGEVRVKVAEGEQTSGVEMRLGPSSTVKGRVLDTDSGQGIPDIVVMGHCTDGDRNTHKETVSDSKGAYVLEGLGVGEYWISVGPDYGIVRDYEPKDLMRVVSLGAGARIENMGFALSTGVQARGQVVDEAGNPVAYATVSAWSVGEGGTGRAQSDRDGRFTIQGLEPSDRVIVQARKLDMVSEGGGPIALPGRGASEGIVLTLGRGASVSGKVVLTDGAPIGGVTVIVDNRGCPGGPLRQVKSRKGDGTFSIVGLAPGTYSVTAYAAGTEQSPESTKRLELGWGENRGDLRLVWSGEMHSRAADSQKKAGMLAISGYVRDQSGVGIGNAWVRAESIEGHTEFHTTADIEGFYELTELPRGEFCVSASGECHAASTRENVRAGSVGVDFALVTWGGVSGVLLANGTGQALSDFEVGIIEAGWTSRSDWVKHAYWTRFSDPDGHFCIHSKEEESEMAVAARAEGMAPAFVHVGVVRPGQEVGGVVLRLKPAWRDWRRWRKWLVRNLQRLRD